MSSASIHPHVCQISSAQGNTLPQITPPPFPKLSLVLTPPLLRAISQVFLFNYCEAFPFLQQQRFNSACLIQADADGALGSTLAGLSRVPLSCCRHKAQEEESHKATHQSCESTVGAAPCTYTLTWSDSRTQIVLALSFYKLS